jgi:hypothetical protein
MIAFGGRVAPEGATEVIKPRARARAGQPVTSRIAMATIPPLPAMPRGVASGPATRRRSRLWRLRLVRQSPPRRTSRQVPAEPACGDSFEMQTTRPREHGVYVLYTSRTGTGTICQGQGPLRAEHIWVAVIRDHPNRPRSAQPSPIWPGNSNVGARQRPLILPKAAHVRRRPLRRSA